MASRFNAKLTLVIEAERRRQSNPHQGVVLEFGAAAVEGLVGL